MTKTPQASNNMGTAGISGLVLKTGIPLMVSLLINSLYNFVDSVFVVRISGNLSLIWVAFVLAEAVMILTVLKTLLFDELSSKIKRMIKLR